MTYTKEEQAIIREAAQVDAAFAKKMGIKTRDVGINLGTPVPGACSISDAWVEVNGTRVTSVPVGSEFVIKATFSAVNNAPALLGNAGPVFTAVVTCIGAGNVANYTDLGTSIFGGHNLSWTGKILDNLGTNIMPAGTGTLQLNFKLWLIDGLNPSPPTPDQSKW